MKLTISVETTSEILTADLPGTLSIDDFKAYLQAETDISPEKQILVFNGKTIGGKTLEDTALSDDDLVILKVKSTSSTLALPNSAPQAEQDPVNHQIEMTRSQLLTNPQMNNQLRQTNPELHSKLNDPPAFKQAMLQAIEQMQNGGGSFQTPQQQEELRRLQQNPDDPENQAKIMEMIRQERIDENMQLAFDLTPESFTSVNMLFINIKVNGVKVQAFVDSGAQTTIISPSLAEKVGVSRLIDRRIRGEACGVGSQMIEGKIHSVPITIGDSNVEIPCSFMVIDTQVDLLFGLDMLRRHKCVIDLQRDVLVVGGALETKFLHELEINSDMFGLAKPNTILGSGPGPSGLGGNLFGSGEMTVPPANAVQTSEVKKLANPAGQAAGQAATKRHNPGTGASAQMPLESDISQITGLGFLRQEAIVALQSCNGNVEMAASMLFQ